MRYNSQSKAQVEEYDNAKFLYSWGLIKSKAKDDIRRGIEMLEELRLDRISRERECMYYISIGHYKLGNYGVAKKCVSGLINSEPSNEQFMSLRSEIDRCINRGTHIFPNQDGILGMAIVGGATALIAGLFIGYSKRKN